MSCGGKGKVWNGIGGATGRLRAILSEQLRSREKLTIWGMQAAADQTSMPKLIAGIAGMSWDSWDPSPCSTLMAQSGDSGDRLGGIMHNALITDWWPFLHTARSLPAKASTGPPESCAGVDSLWFSSDGSGLDECPMISACASVSSTVVPELGAEWSPPNGAVPALCLSRTYHRRIYRRETARQLQLRGVGGRLIAFTIRASLVASNKPTQEF
jgi:hypothetical protein